MSELEDAVRLANRVLDKPYIDPDGDICMLALDKTAAFWHVKCLTCEVVVMPISENTKRGAVRDWNRRPVGVGMDEAALK